MFHYRSKAKETSPTVFWNYWTCMYVFLDLFLRTPNLLISSMMFSSAEYANDAAAKHQ